MSLAATLAAAFGTTEIAYIGAQLRTHLLNQDTHWVPAAAWPEFCQASIRTLVTTPLLGHVNGEDIPAGPAHSDLIVTPDYTVAGIIPVADMDNDYKTSVADFLWQQSRSICQAMSLAYAYQPTLGMEIPSQVQRRDLADMETWIHRANEEHARRTWFDRQKLITALRRA